MLHPDIPEEGPKIGSPRDRNAAGWFVGGPMPATPSALLRLIDEAKGRLVFEDEKPPAPTQAERRAVRKVRRSASRTAAEAQLAAIRLQVAARQVAA